MQARSNIFASYVYIILNIFINLFVVRLTVQHYGDSIYAFVVLAFSFVTYVETFNMGVFLSNRTEIPLRGDNVSVYTVASVKKLFFLSFILLISWLLFYHFYSDTFISAISSEKDEKIVKSGSILINVAVIYGLFKIPLSVVLSSFAGHDRVDIEKKYNALQQIAKFLALYFSIYANLNIQSYFISFCTLGILILIVANIHFYLRFISHKAKIFLKYSKKISASYISRKSFKFYIMTLTTVVVWSTDNLVVSVFFSPKLVSDYSINFSIYNAAFLFVTAIAGAFIANYGNLIRDRLYDTLNFRLNLSIYTAFLIATMFCLGGLLFGKQIIELWVGDNHHISNDLLLIFGFFGTTVGVTSVLNTTLALCASTKHLVYMSLAEATLNLVFSIVFLKIFNVEGVAMGTIAATLIAIILPGLFILKRILGGEIKIKLLSLGFHLLILSLFLLLSMQYLDEIKYKIAIFLVYTLILMVYTLAFHREYIRSYLKMIKRS